MRRHIPGIPLAATVLLLGACAPARAPLPPIEPLPPLPVQQVTPPPPPEPPRFFPAIPGLDELAPGPPITLRALDVDIRALIPVIAESLGLSLVLGPEVQGRLSVHLEDVPALEALRVVLDETGFTLVGRTTPPLWPPVVFYAPPVNVHAASPELVSVHFGVSLEAAELVTGR